MKKALLLLALLLPVSAMAEELGRTDSLRTAILDNLRHAVTIPEVTFVVKNLRTDGNIAYFCGTAIDVLGKKLRTDEGITVYNMFLEQTAPGVWTMIADYTTQAETIAAISCILDDGTELTEQILLDGTEK